MSGQLGLWDDGQLPPDNGLAEAQKRAGLAREIRYLLAISTEAGRRGSVSHAGLAHSLGVCLIEDFNMARGGKSAKTTDKTGNMPRFVDVRLTPEQREEFLSVKDRYGDSARFLQSLADDGYRVGVSWSGEHSAYTVSVTCRDPRSPNNGLCMTSFAGDLITAIALAVYKHVIVAEEVWSTAGSGPSEDFG